MMRIPPREVGNTPIFQTQTANAATEAHTQPHVAAGTTASRPFFQPRAGSTSAMGTRLKATLSQCFKSTSAHSGHEAIGKFERVTTLQWGDAVRKEGFGHVLWGSKPVLLLCDDEYGTLKNLQSQRALKDNFLLIDDGERGGYLVNRYNLQKLVEKHLEYLQQATGAETPRHITDELLASLPTFGKKDAKMDQKLLGVLLGYGLHNATKFVEERTRLATMFQECSDVAIAIEANDVPGPSQPRQRKKFVSDSESANDINQAIGNSKQGALSNGPWIDIPVFATWPSDESTEVIQGFVNDSLDMQQTFLKDALNSWIPDRAIGRAFLDGIFEKL